MGFGSLAGGVESGSDICKMSELIGEKLRGETALKKLRRHLEKESLTQSFSIQFIPYRQYGQAKRSRSATFSTHVGFGFSTLKK
jgi:hypothetical protein